MRVKTIVKIIVAVLALSTFVVFAIFWNGIDLNIQEYQRISANCGDSHYHLTRVIDTKTDEILLEKKYNIKIKDGVDYEQYSLVLSENHEIDKFTMKVFIHPNTCSRGDEKCSQIAICDRELGKKYDNSIIIYIAKQKNIISRDEAEVTYL